MSKEAPYLTYQEEAERAHRSMQRFHLAMIAIDALALFFVWKMSRK